MVIKMNKRYRSLVFSAMCLALAIVMPFLTGQIPEIGAALLPMHIPILLCGFICGPAWGAAVGAAAPLFRCAMFGMPPFPSTALPMAFELAVYGLAAGILYRLLPRRAPYIYVSLLGAMICGRVVWGCVKLVITAARAETFTLGAFIAGALTGSIPGIICQIILIPLIVIALERAGLTNTRENQ